MQFKSFLLPALLIAIIFVPFAAAVFLSHGIAVFFLEEAAALRKMGFAGEVVFCGFVGILALVGIVPGALLGIAAGAVYGVAAGFITSGIGVLIGAVIAFLLSRSIMRPLIAKALGKRARLNALDDLVTRDRWRIVFLLRISPVMPFSLTSYALGLSGIGLQDYFAGTLAAMPPLFGYVVIGALGSSTLEAHSHKAALVHIALLVFGIVATLALTIHLGRLLARAVKPA